MITKNPMQLKAYIKKKAAEKHISAQLVMQNYMLERLLERISLSPYGCAPFCRFRWCGGIGGNSVSSRYHFRVFSAL